MDHEWPGGHALQYPSAICSLQGPPIDLIETRRNNTKILEGALIFLAMSLSIDS